jgi:signal peptide peptidase SppA
MSTYKYERYLSRVTRQPWAITPEMFATLIDLMRFRASGHRLSDEEIQARIGEDRERRQERQPQGGAVAVIPIHGVIAHRADSFMASSGGASTEAIGRMFQQAIADEGVKAILLDIDSPGGNVEGVPELADLIYQAKGRGTKRVVAHANAMAASAAYWLATQADELVITPSGMVGSIGVYLLLEDLTAYLEKEGIKINAISAGENKLEGAPWEPLGDEAKTHLQGQVNAVYKQFLAAVARGRRTSQANVKESFGQGRVYAAPEALKRGMVDAVETFDATVSRLINKRSSVSIGPRGSGLIGAPEAIVPLDQIVGEASVPLTLTLAGEQATEETYRPAIDAETVIGVDLASGPDSTVEAAVDAEGAVTALNTIANLDAQREADLDYADAAIRIRERQ